jgi:hypothetical protein
MEIVRLKDPQNMNVLGLLLHGFLRSVLEDPALAARAKGMKGCIWLRAGLMWASLCFDGKGIEIVRGKTAERRAAVEGDMHVLLGVVTSSGLRGLLAMAGLWLRGKLRLGGNLIFLLRLLPILTAGGR